MGKKEDIMNATLSLIMTEGIQAITFSKIFEAANVGSSTFYYYYKNKEELVDDIYRQAERHMGGALIEGYPADATAFQKSNCIVGNMIQFGMDFPKELLFVESYSDSPAISKEVRDADVEGMRDIYEVISSGQEEGNIALMNPTLCMYIVKGIVANAIRGYFAGKYDLDATAQEQLKAACWKAIKM
ncbi:TetR/AcrR family transcriptional regulator [Fructobacillus durionis]|uniref:Transcriptional regulator, TetR family n=1 Tax=Fructobacillus durionis TaxID=283737 RepID=A0A1I1G612_9LACO|nr:TetR/AcrR family transcriptional regulator [Fructobacillus durionis]SFC07024.1 transcriptional regulator, TetR family [Fructobacillus durionis]